MDKYEFFLLSGVKEGNYIQKSWCLSLLTSFRFSKTPTYRYPLLRNDVGYYTIEPDQTTPIYITDQGKRPDPREPLFHLADEITLRAGDLPNVTETVDTTIGKALLNLICVCFPFGSKVAYYNGRKIKDYVGDQLASRLKDDDKQTSDSLSITEYYKAVNAFNDFLPGLSAATTVTATERSLTQPPDMEDLRTQVIKQALTEGKDVTDPMVYKAIEDKLNAYVDEYMKDDPAYGNFIAGKVRNVAYKKYFITKGMEPDFDFKLGAPIIASLSEGGDLNPETLVAEYNSLRVGSYSRAKDTQKGGTYGKWVQRTVSTLSVATEEDCGTTHGVRRKFNDATKHIFKNTMIYNGQTWVKATPSQLTKNTYYVTRSMGYCQHPDPAKYCKACAGEQLSDNAQSLLNAATEISFGILNASLKRMHTTGVINTVDIDLDEVFS